MKITPTNLTFEIPSNPGTTCKINVTMGLTSAPYDYTQSAGRTPSITVADKTNGLYNFKPTNTLSRAVKFIVARYLDSSGEKTSSAY
jgi:hypothetical protein